MTPREFLQALTDKASNLLRGEPLRAIGYGGAAVVYFVANGFDAIPDMSFDAAVSAAVAAGAILVTFVEAARRVVYSPNTVNAILEELSRD
jgi:hypothetical protein